MKITRTTFKSFVNKNKNNLYCKVKNSFDGMVDCVMPVNGNWEPADFNEWAANSPTNTLGIRQVWLVGQSRDYFNAYEDDQYTGIEYTNCCGSGVIAIKK